MVFRRAFFISVAVLLAGQAQAAPFFLKTSGLTARSAAPLDSISTFGRRIPSEIAVRAPDGVVLPFSKREEEELLKRQDNSTSTSSGNVTVTVDNTPPSSVPTDNLNKVNPQNIPEEVPASSPSGIVQAYPKREGRLFGRQGNVTVTVDNSAPSSVPTDNLNKVNPQNIPEEVPASSPNGIVQAYPKREGRLFGRQDNSTGLTDIVADNSTSGNITVTVDNSAPPPVPSGNENGLNPDNINDNDATSADNGIVTSYDKRGHARRFISSEIPTRSLNGEIELF